MRASKLTNLQQELLKVFSIDLSENDLLEIRQLLANHFAKKASDGMDALWDKNQWDQKTMEAWLKEHPRSA